MCTRSSRGAAYPRVPYQRYAGIMPDCPMDRRCRMAGAVRWIAFLHSMRRTVRIHERDGRPANSCRVAALASVCAALAATRAEASLFSGEALDKVADIMAIVVLIVVPVVVIVVFWLVHVLPERF